ncbi:glycosyltransferase involved in cell wall biosynthesis [Sphingomonas leidyi]|uniref:Glycosyltransferase involved in cell wall biosynthesis n=1 Tax=Sphingomonas leidyi TaxID=68569 RepID=A0A7X5ZXQ1_9SPHN|nr:glycosyltransferase [Sphingomonas leidyi]NIJ67421.1 glycosyltransferase involved in cell wall biosynthesis [Sphingomonas leidyi]
MLRVLVLSTLFPDASRPNFGIFVERQTRALAEREDAEVRVVAPLGLPPWPLARLSRYARLAALPERETWNGLTVHRPRFRNLPGTGGRFHARALAAALAPLLRAIHREFPFDVISAEFFFPDGPAAVLLGERIGVPVSIKARGSDIHDWGRRKTIGPQVIAAGRRADGVLSVSDALRADMIAMGIPGEKIETIATGVDLARFAPRDRAAAKAELGIDGPLVLSVGALIPIKGHDIVIDAVSTLPGVTLWIAGEGPDRKRLEARIEQLGLGDRVRLLGSIPPDRVAAALAAADAMALASEREGLANAWLEALASGTPIVVPDVGGARQVVTAPAAGSIVPRAPAAFAEALGALIAAPPAPADTRAVAAPFTWAANSTRLHAFLQRLVDRRHGT